MEASAAAAQLESFSPATGERLGAVAMAHPRAVAAAVDEAAGVQPLWATLRLGDRARRAPAVLSGVTPGMRLAREEVPGPVLAVEAVRTEEEAVARANEAALGLGASVWTADRSQGRAHRPRAARGMVWMNDHLVARSAPQIPWGGVGGAGIGRARGAIALRTCAEPRVVTWDPPIGRPVWWFPYDGALVGAARAVAGLRSARDRDRERAWRRDGLALLRVTGRWLRAMRRG